MDLIIEKNVLDIDGDFVEIGCFLGGGTFKLSNLIRKTSKKIYAIDLFDPTFDNTICTEGEKMCTIYQKTLKGKSQEKIYKEIIKDCTNIITIVGDSKKVILPCRKISFGFIDGNHSLEYVESDFSQLWQRTVSGGIIAFDDYGSNLPLITKAIHNIISSNIEGIAKIGTTGKKIIWLQKN